MRTKQSPISILPWFFWIVTIGFIVVSRWIYKSQYLFHHDSVQFALALNEFDVTKHQPHPPGYIIYVWMAKLVNYFVDNPNVAFIIVGILATIVGLVAIYYLAKNMFGQVAGYLTGLFYVVNASVWFHGLVAEVYIVEVAFILLALVFIYRFWRKGNQIDLLWMMVLVALVGGIRQTAELFILPVAVYTIFANKKVFLKCWRESVGVWLIVNLLWAVPLVYFSGGIVTYFKSLAMLSGATIVEAYATQGVNILITNGSLLWQTIKQAVPVGLVVLFIALLPFMAEESKKRFSINLSAIKWWLWAILPGIVLIQFILMRNPGYGLYFVVLLLILTAGGLMVISRAINEWRKGWGRVVTTALVLIMLGIQTFGFFNHPARSLDYTSASLPSITWVEKTLDDVLAYFQNFKSEESIIFTSNDLVFFGVRHLQYYLPDFDIYSYRPLAMADDDISHIWHVRGEELSQYQEKIEIPQNAKYLIFWSGNDQVPASENFIRQETGAGHAIGYFDLTKADTREELSQGENYKYLILN